MYSTSWFDTFARTVPESTTEADVAAIARLAPPELYPRLLDLGCGVGRVLGPLAALGYRLTGIDTNVDALLSARHSAPNARFVALDQRHVGQLRWTFDAAIVLWNSFGFGERSGDLETLRGLQRVLRPGGRLLLDLYHPDWLASHQQSGLVDARGATIDRWIQGGRCYHEIRYADGSVDEIQFNVYRPDEIGDLLHGADMQVDLELVWWKPESRPGAQCARYQVICTRPE